MSKRLRNWLLIGGGVFVGLIVILFLIYMIMGRSNGVLAPAVGNADSRQAQILNFAGQPELAQAPGFGGGAASDAVGAVPAEAQPASGTTNAGVTDQTQRLIVRNGSVTVSVANTYDARNQILGLVNQMTPQGAFIVSVNESGGGGDVSPYITMVIRVPEAQFNATMDAVAKLAAQGTTPQRSETAQDVTAEYVDVKARLDSMELARTRLQQIMSEAQNTTDLLQAETLLTQREADIEALKGRMQYLEQSASLSEITVSLAPYILSQPVDTSWKPGETLRRAFDDLLDSLRGFADFLIYFAVAVLPWLLLAGLIIYGVVRFIGRRVRRNQIQQAVSTQQQDD